jgi:hypothetical protein
MQLSTKRDNDMVRRAHLIGDKETKDEQGEKWHPQSNEGNLTQGKETRQRHLSRRASNGRTKVSRSWCQWPGQWMIPSCPSFLFKGNRLESSYLHFVTTSLSISCRMVSLVSGWYQEMIVSEKVMQTLMIMSLHLMMEKPPISNVSKFSPKSNAQCRVLSDRVPICYRPREWV